MNLEFRTANLNKTTKKPLTSSGFTLIEILVVTAILGIMLSVAANVIITILRNQNKANLVAEIRQNADLVINTFERDVRSAKRAAINGAIGGANSITLTLPDDTLVVWLCSARVANTTNGYISRAIAGGPAVSVTNTDLNNGVSVTNSPCNIFSGDNAAAATAITLNFTLRQGEENPSKVEFSTSDVQFKTTVGPRAVPR